VDPDLRALTNVNTPEDHARLFTASGLHDTSADAAGDEAAGAPSGPIGA
jgi:hypothetical protein